MHIEVQTHTRYAASSSLWRSSSATCWLSSTTRPASASARASAAVAAAPSSKSSLHDVINIAFAVYEHCKLHSTLSKHPCPHMALRPSSRRSPQSLCGEHACGSAQEGLAPQLRSRHSRVYGPVGDLASQACIPACHKCTCNCASKFECPMWNTVKSAREGVGLLTHSSMLRVSGHCVSAGETQAIMTQRARPPSESARISVRTWLR